MRGDERTEQQEEHYQAKIERRQQSVRRFVLARRELPEK
jgi:hypothetical protein